MTVRVEITDAAPPRHEGTESIIVMQHLDANKIRGRRIKQLDFAIIQIISIKQIEQIEEFLSIIKHSFGPNSLPEAEIIDVSNNEPRLIE